MPTVLRGVRDLVDEKDHIICTVDITFAAILVIRVFDLVPDHGLFGREVLVTTFKGALDLFRHRTSHYVSCTWSWTVSSRVPTSKMECLDGSSKVKVTVKQKI